MRVSQEVTHSLTRACAMPLPRSSEARARAMPEICLSLPQTLSGWQLIENQAILSWDEGSLQTYWLDARRSAPVAGNARGRDFDLAAVCGGLLQRSSPSIPSTG